MLGHADKWQSHFRIAVMSMKPKNALGSFVVAWGQPATAFSQSECAVPQTTSGHARAFAQSSPLVRSDRTTTTPISPLAGIENCRQHGV